MTTARKNKDLPHYVNNKEFSAAVVALVEAAKAAGYDPKKFDSIADAEAKGIKVPRIPEYIGSCFLRICEGLSHKPNFIRYTYRDEMVCDAIENCIKAVFNFNVEAATRSGAPNAFAYFTQIAYYAFLRRIQKEKKQQDIKYRYMEHCGADDMMTNHESTGDGGGENSFLEQIKKKNTREAPQRKIDKVVAETMALEKFMPE
jgi:hypothetical protein